MANSLSLLVAPLSSDMQHSHSFIPRFPIRRSGALQQTFLWHSHCRYEKRSCHETQRLTCAWLALQAAQHAAAVAAVVVLSRAMLSPCSTQGCPAQLAPGGFDPTDRRYTCFPGQHTRLG